MKAIAQLGWTYCTALPVQRWVGWFALGTWALVLLVKAAGGPAILALGFIGTGMYLMATAFTAGYLFRQWSAPRTHGMLPRFRARTLAAFLAVVTLLSAPGLALLALPWHPATFAAGVGLLFIFNLIALITFEPKAGVIAGTLIVIFGTLAAPSPAELARGGGLGVSPFAAGAAVWIALWAAFGAWYLRVRSVGRLQWPPRALLDGRLDVRLFADTTGKFSLASALATAFTATYPLRAKHRLMLLAIGIAVIAGSIPLLRRLPTPIGMSVLLSALSTSSFIVAPAANQVARRTRSLWLAIGKSRRALFGAAERQVWRSNLPRALVSFASLAAMAALSFDLPADLIGRIALVWVGSTVLGAYLGLAEVEGLHALEICIGVAYFGSIALGLYAALGEPRYDLLFGVAAVQLVATAGFRFLAIARWNRLDWLKFRPLRTPAQSVRAGG